MSFVDYPKAHQAEQWSKGPEVDDKNPALRGPLLAVAGTIVSKLPALQKFLWSNAGFGSLRDYVALSGVIPRFVPLVIPVENNDQAIIPSATNLDSVLYERAAADLIGRYHTAADYHNAYKSGNVTPLQVAEALHSLVLRGQDPRSKYDNAWVDSHGADNIALEAARQSTERWKQGRPLGLLDGVPFGVKDDLDVKDYVSHMGLKYQSNLSFQKPAEETIHPVRKLQEAGAIMIGKNAMHELGCDTTGCNFNNGLDYLKTLGYEVVEITIPNLKECQLAHGAACLTEMAEQHRSRIGKDSNWMKTVNNATKIMLGVGSCTPGLDLIKYHQLRTVLMEHMAYIFKTYPGIIILSPTSPQIGWPRNQGDEAYGVNDANTSLRNMMYIFLANMVGCPALTAPIGFVNPEQGEGQLPIGMMAMNEWGAEESLLAWAADTERYLNEKQDKWCEQGFGS
ncbi:Fatty acid amide hydrolase [Ceratocystis platani]|uniref:Fatty acid amide hydrolase n=1 Tax=Ceratocystis fimbriata f. sp. platani TaxID=88771 RepID=A0A0F8CZ43_CERFI|nr:Fatty acid amide hydrolase [Ceratocystis platani]